MSEPSITFIDEQRRRSRRVSRAVAARARLRSLAPAEDERLPGRAWINGREVGGTDPLYKHLTESYD